MRRASLLFLAVPIAGCAVVSGMASHTPTSISSSVFESSEGIRDFYIRYPRRPMEYVSRLPRHAHSRQCKLSTAASSSVRCASTFRAWAILPAMRARFWRRPKIAQVIPCALPHIGAESVGYSVPVVVVVVL